MSENEKLKYPLRHDTDGKMYIIDENGNTKFLFEVLIEVGDYVEKIVNNLIEKNIKAVITPDADLIADNKRLVEACKKAMDNLNEAYNAFTQNWCVDWNEYAETAKEIEGLLQQHEKLNKE